jgi:hypothetical protein
MGDPELERAKAAVRAFEDGSLDLPEGLTASFRLWHYPQQGPWITWILFVPTGGEPYETDGAVREIGWNRDTAGPEPDLWAREAVVPAATLRRALTRASQIALLQEAVGTEAFPDWTEFGIEGFSAVGSRRVQWEAPVPYPFRTIAVWFSRTRALLEGCLR